MFWQLQVKRKVTVKVTGLKSMVKLMKKLPNKIARNVARASLIASAKPIIKQYKDNLEKHKRTGKLKRSIKAKSAGKSRIGPADEVVVLVGPTEDGFYAGFLEFGTSRIPAEHPFRDALESRRDEQHRILGKEFAKRVPKEVRKLRGRG